MEKIIVAELLKDCPKGMELDCTMYEDVYFDYVDILNTIHCYIQHETYKASITFNQFGTPNSDIKSKCAIFPKGKTTWEGFQRPFKDGDIIFTHANCLNIGLGNTWISIFQEYRNGGVATYVDYAEVGQDYYDNADGDKGLLCMEKEILRQRLATEEEKQRLFKAIKENGYRWNPETKTLEKLSQPKFKVGDRIRRKNSNEEYTIISISAYTYYYRLDEHCTGSLGIQLQDDYELVPNKFDITTLKPFESRVLVRNVDGDLWKPAIYGFPHSKGCYVVGGAYWGQCIPYEENKELLGTTNNPAEYGSR